MVLANPTYVSNSVRNSVSNNTYVRNSVSNSVSNSVPMWETVWVAVPIQNSKTGK
jgi:hypothetical protein